MPTLYGYIREMCSRDPTLGRVEGIASLTTVNTVVTALAVGSLSAERFQGKWLFRGDTATTADRIRHVTDFTASSGTLIHAGTNFADTTATDETVAILRDEPWHLINAVQIALARFLRLDRTVIPARTSQRRNWIGDLDWIAKPSDVASVQASSNPVLSRNRYFEKWSAYNSSGVLAPDHWTIAGASATMARSTTGNRRGSYTLAIMRSGTNCTVLQTVGLLDAGGVTDSDLRGKTLTAVIRARSAVASQLRATVLDGTQTLLSSYHTGGSGVEELTIEITVATTATTLEFGISVVTDNTAVQIEEAYLVESTALSDAVRYDDWNEYEIPMEDVDFDQSGTLSIGLPKGYSTYIVNANRAFPQFDTTRVAAGTADADSSDAPLVPIAVNAIARLYEELGQPGLAQEWGRRADNLALSHLYQPTKGREFGKVLQGGYLGPPGRRF